MKLNPERTLVMLVRMADILERPVLDGVNPPVQDGSDVAFF